LKREKQTEELQYHPGYLHMMLLYAQVGYDDQQIAEFIKVPFKAFKSWKASIVEVQETLDKGRQGIIALVGAEALKNCFDRYVETEVVAIVKGHPEVVKVQKFEKGDKWLQMKWLSLMKPDTFSEVHRVSIQSNINITSNLKLETLDMEELALAKKLGISQVIKREAEDAEFIEE
jgi:hypothetical protein